MKNQTHPIKMDFSNDQTLFNIVRGFLLLPGSNKTVSDAF